MIKGKDLINKIKEKKYIWDRIHSDVEVFIINKYGGIEKSTGGSEYSEDVIIENNNEYVREDFAKYKKIKRKYEYQLRKATTKAWEEYNEDIDWNNKDQCKYFIRYYYNFDDNIAADWVAEMSNLPYYYYFPTNNSCARFIKKNKELINKFFNLKEEI